MKKLLCSATALFLLNSSSLFAQNLKMPSVTTTDVNAKYASLMNQDIPTVMKSLKLTAKDTIGKTGTAYFKQIDPNAKFTTLKMPTGETLGFKNNKLSVIVPKQNGF